jgi:CRP/FNR family transcriptional regulator, dissimilatory nitrate respiration regulator
MNPFLLLGQVSFFKGISPDSRRALARICLPVEMKKRQVVFRERDRGDAFYLLVQGRVQLHKTAPDGREIVIKVIKPGEVFAEVVLFEESRYPVTAVALTGCLLLKILRRDLHELLRTEDFRGDFIAMLMRKQRYLADRIRQLASHSVEDRFFDFLREQYGDVESIAAALPKKDVAAAIGTTPETVSRLIRKLAKSGALTWKGRSIRLRPGFWRSRRQGL